MIKYAERKLVRIMKWRGIGPRNTHFLTARFAAACMPELADMPEHKITR